MVQPAHGKEEHCSDTKFCRVLEKEDVALASQFAPSLLGVCRNNVKSLCKLGELCASVVD